MTGCAHPHPTKRFCGFRWKNWKLKHGRSMGQDSVSFILECSNEVDWFRNPRLLSCNLFQYLQRFIDKDDGARRILSVSRIDLSFLNRMFGVPAIHLSRVLIKLSLWKDVHIALVDESCYWCRVYPIPSGYTMYI